MSKRAFQILLAALEELVDQLAKKGVIDSSEILQLVDVARNEAKKR